MSGGSLDVDQIPVVHTPPGGWTDIPPLILAGCTDPVVDGAPDLAGWWEVIEVIGDDGQVISDHRAIGTRQRNEQCGDRIVVVGNGVIHDMRCDGTLEGAVHDVAEFDKATPITVIATYEDGRHVLRPVGIPVEVIRWREGDYLMWKYLGFTARMAYLGPPDEIPGPSPVTTTGQH
jgi:hypothetical protein